MWSAEPQRLQQWAWKLQVREVRSAVRSELCLAAADLKHVSAVMRVGRPRTRCAGCGDRGYLHHGEPLVVL